MLLKTHPYQNRFNGQWYEGKTHRIDPEDTSRTMCGKEVGSFPASEREEDEGTLDCKGCLKAIESREKQREWEQKIQAEAAEADLKRQWEEIEWRQRYENYLQTDRWKHKRNLVLNRCHGLCEGCGENYATEVHHLTYKRLGEEMLFDLVGLCSTCHNAIHGDMS